MCDNRSCNDALPPVSAAGSAVVQLQDADFILWVDFLYYLISEEAGNFQFSVNAPTSGFTFNPLRRKRGWGEKIIHTEASVQRTCTVDRNVVLVSTLSRTSSPPRPKDGPGLFVRLHFDVSLSVNKHVTDTHTHTHSMSVHF